MSYRLKLTVTISLLIALSFGIGGTLMITTSFRETLNQQTQLALSAFDHLQKKICSDASQLLMGMGNGRNAALEVLGQQ